MKQKRSTARPGQQVRGSKTGRPIMAAFDLLGRRWTMRILWELSAGSCTFRALADRVGNVVPSTLNRRLQEMREMNLLIHNGDGYELTDLGQRLVVALDPLRDWAEQWAQTIQLDGEPPA